MKPQLNPLVSPRKPRRGKLGDRRPAVKEFEIEIDAHLQFSATHRWALLNGQGVHLTPIEYRLLQTFWQRRGQVLSPGLLLASAWTSLHGGGHRTLWVHIRRLRRKIETDPDQPHYIVTVLGQGYCLSWPQGQFAAT